VKVGNETEWAIAGNISFPQPGTSENAYLDQQTDKTGMMVRPSTEDIFFIGTNRTSTRLLPQFLEHGWLFTCLVFAACRVERAWGRRSLPVLFCLCTIPRL